MDSRGTDSEVETLVKRCLQGDANAWGELVTRYAPLVHTVAHRAGLTTAEIEDVGQEVFLALAQGLERIIEPARLPSWLITTTRRFSWRTLYARRQEQPGAEADLNDGEFTQSARMLVAATPTLQDFLNEWQRQEIIGQAMTRLNQRCRDLLTLIFLDETEPSYADISQRLNLPKGSIGPMRNRCLQQLRQYLALEEAARDS
jgi:RNA polymerase sigma factor (sigma-70 family)